MRKEQIISKGIYTGAQYPELVSVKQYIIFRKDTEKCLLLRFSNDRNESVNAVRFKLRQLDVKGNVLCNDVYFFDGINAGAGKTFALDREISIDEGCVDFTVEIDSAQYGEYEYTLKNGELIAAYNEKSDAPPFDKEKIRKKFKGENQNITGKTLHAPKMILFSMLAALLIIAAFSYAQLRYFMSTEETFTLENVEYAFTTEDRESGPIAIISYKGKAGNVIVPAEIEGHKVESIAEGAFKRRKLVSVFIEGDLSIGDYAFADCQYLESVEMPNVTYLGEGIFEGCSSLVTVKTEKLTHIGEKAFLDCKSLEDIKLPSTLNEIEAYAFSGCKSIKEFSIPDSTEKIGEGILTGCSGISTLKLPYIGNTLSKPDTMKYLFGRENFGKNTDNLVSITVTKMTVVADEAFSGCSAVQSISLPDNVTDIGIGAFRSCKSLKEFVIPTSVRTIGVAAFSGCASLKDVNIPSNVSELPTGVFSGCKSLVSVSLPSSLLHIRVNAFRDCESISAIILPVNIQTLEAGAFTNCTGIKDMTLSFIGTTVNDPYILEELFATTETQLENIRVRGAKFLAENTFSGFSNLVSVNIGGMIDTIERYCFADAYNLKTVVLPDSVVQIEEGAFANCVSLESVNIPEGITVINDKTFLNCESLAELDISENVTAVGESAFAGCKALTDTEWIERISEIGNNAFEGCEGIESVTINSAVAVLPDALFKDCINLSEVVVPSAVTSVGNNAFYGCESLESITIPQSVTYIGSGAFAFCKEFTEISIPANVIEIGDGAFEGCTGIDNLVIPAAVETIGSEIAKECSSLKELIIPFLGRNNEVNETIKYVLGDNIPESLERVVLLEEDSIAEEAFCECANIKEIVLNEGIKYIGSYAFYKSGIDAIEIPSSVTSVEKYAFASTSITKITIPSGVTVLGNGILSECLMEEVTVPFIGSDSSKVGYVKYLFDNYSVPDSLKRVEITAATSIEERAFSGCRFIEEIEISGNIIEIGEGAFSDCTSLTSIAIPDTVKIIGDYCFQRNEKLLSLTLPDSLEKIGSRILEGCNSITEISIPFVGLEKNDANKFYIIFSEYNGNIPESLKSITVTNETIVKANAFSSCHYVEEIVYEKDIESIGANAFSSCNRLKSMELPNTLTEIGEWAFSWCYDLSSIVIPSSVESIGYSAFNFCCNLLEVYNYSSIEEYRIWETSLRSYCVVYRTDDTAVSKVESNNLEFILGDDGNWYFNKSTNDAAKIVFPESITFENDEITQYFIPGYSFYQNTGITSVTVTNAIVNIGYEAFYGCENLKEVYNLSDMNIQRGSYDYGRIGYYAYVIHTSADEEELTEVKIDGKIFLKSDDNWFFKGYDGEEKKLVLDEFEYDGKTVSSYEILEHAFDYNSPVEELIIGNAVKKIGKQSFYNMVSLKKVSFEGNTSITTIPNNCFANSYNLGQVILPSSLTSIEYNAFYECSMLLEIYNLSDIELTLGSNDNGYVAKYAVIIHNSMDEEPLTEVKIGDFTYLKSDDLWILNRYNGNASALELRDFEYNGKKITSYTISGRAFSNCYTLKEIVIGNEVKNIRAYAFESCYNVEKVSFEDNTQITVIPEHAFAYCNNLKTVILPASLEAIEYYAFGDCNNLIEVYNPSELVLTMGSEDNGRIAKSAIIIHTSLDEEPLKKVTIDGFEFMTNEDNIWGLINYTGNKETIDFKGIKYNDKTVQNIVILSYAFQNANTVKKVIFGNEVSDIRRNAFSNNRTLEYVSFKDCSNITVIPEYAFIWCSNLNTVVLSQYITDIRYDAFWECNSMYNVCNLSMLPISAGSTGYGCIGQYAKNICYSEEDIVEFKAVEEQNIRFLFKKVSGKWEMYETGLSVSYIDTLILPELIIDDEVQEYDITVDLPGCQSLVIPESVKSIRNANTMSIGRILYFGEGEALKLFNDIDSTEKLCYVECVHRDGEWTYGQNGTIITNYDVTMSERAPTCTVVGADVYACNRCGEEWEENIIKLRTHVVDTTTNKCENCDAQFAPGVTSEYWEITNDITYPFDLSDNGSIKSTNTVEGTVAEMVLVAKKSFSVRFKGDIPQGTDYGRGMLSFVVAGNLSGCIYTNEYPTNTHSLRVNEGDTVTITFTKGSSQDGKDCFTLSDFIYADEQGG